MENTYEISSSFEMQEQEKTPMNSCQTNSSSNDIQLEQITHCENVII